MKVFVIWSFALVAACGVEERCVVPTSFSLESDETRGPFMRAGQNCLRCHASNGEARNKPFSFGGTIFPAADSGLCDGVEGVTVRVTDSKGKVVTVTSNRVGNFWSAEPLTPPLSMEAERGGRVTKMPVTAPTGGCALCHSWPDAVSASGRIRAP